MTSFQHWFEQFWQQCERTSATDGVHMSPLIRVGPLWEYWWRDLSKERRLALGQVGEKEQQEFLSWLRDWCDKRYGAGKNCSRLILLQLRHHQPFSSWPCLQSSKELRGTNAVIVSGCGGCPEDIREIHAFVIPTAPNLPAVATPALGLDPMAIEQVRAAVASLLCGAAFLRFQFLWLAGGWMCARPRWQVLLFAASFTIAIASCAGLILFDVTEPVLATLASLTIIIVAAWIAVAVLALLWSGIEGRRLRSVLKKARLVVIVQSRSSDTNLDVSGASFGAALFVELLRAMGPLFTKAHPLGQCISRIDESIHRWMLTGRVAGSGWIQSVSRMTEKITAGILHQDISEMAAPRRQDLQAASGKARRGGSERRYPETSSAYAKEHRLEASTIKAFRIRKFVDGVNVMFAVAGIRGATWIIARMIVLAGFVVTAAVGLDSLKILFPPREPLLLAHASEFTAKGDYLALAFENSPQTAAFQVQLTSHYWANRIAPINSRGTDPRYPQPTAWILLTRIAAGDHWDRLDGEITVLYSRKILWRTIQPLTLQRAPLRILTMATTRGGDQ